MADNAGMELVVSIYCGLIKKTLFLQGLFSSIERTRE